MSIFIGERFILINNIKESARREKFDELRYLSVFSAAATGFASAFVGGATLLTTGLFAGDAYFHPAATAGAIVTATGLAVGSNFVNASLQGKLTGIAAAAATAFAIAAFPHIAKGVESEIPQDMQPVTLEFEQWGPNADGTPLNCIIDPQGKAVPNWDGTKIDCSVYLTSETPSLSKP